MKSTSRKKSQVELLAVEEARGVAEVTVQEAREPEAVGVVDHVVARAQLVEEEATLVLADVGEMRGQEVGGAEVAVEAGGEGEVVAQQVEEEGNSNSESFAMLHRMTCHATV